LTQLFTPGQHIHIVGIGGSGMSAVARILLERGFKVSGSDRTLSPITEALQRSGATIYQGHDATHIEGADIVLISSAIQNNPEIIAANEYDIPVYKRREFMAALTEGKEVIAIAGTAGKTTTTALITHILRFCDRDPSYIVGGTMGNTGTNAGNGNGKWFVIEADEYDNMFHGLKPDIAVITNLDYDHPDFFKTETDMIDSFRHFASLVPPTGALLFCADNAGSKRLYHEVHHTSGSGHTYGLSEDAHYRAENIRVTKNGKTVFDIVWSAWTDEEGNPQKYYPLGTIHSPLSGNHNVQNVLAAVAVTSRFVNVPFDEVARAVETFKGTGRRFEIVGEKDGVIVIDDYAHHPSKIRATLQAARSRYPNHTLWAVWQPHTYSRTQTLMDDFATSFDDADHVIVTEIYAAREAPIMGVTGETIAAKIKHKNVNFSTSLDATVTLLVEKVQKPAIIVVMSAGDASRIARDYLAEIK
jgi:UDP-N-acetylmuramate--alanine ligase